MRAIGDRPLTSKGIRPGIDVCVCAFATGVGPPTIGPVDISRAPSGGCEKRVDEPSLVVGRLYSKLCAHGTVAVGPVESGNGRSPSMRGETGCVRILSVTPDV